MHKLTKTERLAKQIKQAHTQRNHLTEELAKVEAALKAKQDDTEDTSSDDACEAAVAEVTQSLAAQNAKLAKLTGSLPPPVDEEG